MTIYEQISQDIVVAMKAKDKIALDALRNIKKYFIEAKTTPGAGGVLSDEAALKILAKLSKQGKETASIYANQGRQDLADSELAQVDIINRYLPIPLTHEELELAIREIIEKVGAVGIKDMGRVMGEATKQLSGRAEGRAISAIVKPLLA